ncbi:RteC domain-containing protein [Salinimicrobium sp. GXAS 041]|uniref:RteC domain-containing protein n=1 Tax=Salinimicrobium sp. GXAS 041 TaxID=3400806 RepID=UPI003C75A3B1
MKRFHGIMESFEQKIAVILDSPEQQIRVTNKGIDLCNRVLTELKDLIEKEDLESVEEEIHFFKEVKPSVMSYLIYFTEVRSCEIRKPKAGVNFQVRFFEKEIKKVNKFFYRNIDFSHYMELGHNYLDHQLFTRNYQNNFPFTPLVNYYQFPEFSTSHDMLWSKIKAMHRFLHYIRKCLGELRPGRSFISQERKHPVLFWTSSKTALTELIYALYSDGALNHGAADLNTITTSFEDFFNVKLDNVYKTYSEIKARKGSKTKFLEELMLNLQQKMSKEDGL